MKALILTCILSISTITLNAQIQSEEIDKKLLLNMSVNYAFNLNHVSSLEGYNMEFIIPTKIKDLNVVFCGSFLMDFEQEIYGGGAFIGAKTFKGSNSFGITASSLFGYCTFGDHVYSTDYSYNFINISGFASTLTLGVYFGNKKIKISPAAKMLVIGDTGLYTYLGPELSLILNF